MENITRAEFTRKHNDLLIRMEKLPKKNKKILMEFLSKNDLGLLIIKAGLNFHGDFDYSKKNALLHIQDMEKALDLFL